MYRTTSAVLTAGLLAACGGDGGNVTPPPPPPPPSSLAACASQPVVQLAVGAHQVVDPAQTSGCLRVPAAGAQGAAYLVVAASTTSTLSATGVSGGYHIRTGVPATAAPQATVARIDPIELPFTARVSNAARFDGTLRKLEQRLAADPAAHAVARAPGAIAAPPAVGNVRTFKACGDLECDNFVDVTATARYVGTKAAIYADQTVPTVDSLQDADYLELGQTFDNRLYAIDQAAFGTESDIDGNERIVILMTDAVNNLTPDCTNGRVVGYFFGGDLVTSGPNAANSNKSEVFFTLVPSPATPTCNALTRANAVRGLKPTLIHELQHMISWNQRVIVRSGNSEETWLNEALSHYAEELGGRLIPDAECQGASSCRSLYSSGNLFNSYDYFKDTEASFLIYPGSSSGTLEERGASWSFLRWVVDQFATDTLVGSDFTPGLIQTTIRGANNIAARSGASFSEMVPEWLMAAYLDDRPGFAALSPRLRFRSWGLRGIWTNPANAQVFPQGFPLKPDSTNGAYTRTGTLRGGSGRHLILYQAPNGSAIDFQLVRDAQGAPIDPALSARLGIARIR